jgi:hypothetical protein
MSLVKADAAAQPARLARRSKSFRGGLSFPAGAGMSDAFRSLPPARTR